MLLPSNATAGLSCCLVVFMGCGWADFEDTYDEPSRDDLPGIDGGDHRVIDGDGGVAPGSVGASAGDDAGSTDTAPPCGECAVGQEDFEDCGNCGVRTRRCGPGCTWGEWGNCVGSGPCAPGQSEDGPCGACGTASRSCSDDCAWEPWQACRSEGECAAGAVEVTECGCGGAQERTCGESCAWAEWGACQGSTFDPPGAGDFRWDGEDFSLCWSDCTQARVAVLPGPGGFFYGAGFLCEDLGYEGCQLIGLDASCAEEPGDWDACFGGLNRGDTFMCWR